MMNEKWIHGEFFVGVSGSILGEISKVICGGISEEFLEWFKKKSECIFDRLFEDFPG